MEYKNVRLKLGRNLIDGWTHVWENYHGHGLFSKIIICENSNEGSPVAKINIKTKELTINMYTLYCAAYKLKIKYELFIFYTVSHEFGHLLYKQTDKIANEEYFAHNYACEDCYMYLKSVFNKEDFEALNNILDKLIL